MPIYEYQCKACGHTFDTLQSFSEEPLSECPVCQEPALKKLVSQAAFHLKGSGWYVTDFKNPQPKAKADNPDKTKTEDKDPSAKKDSTHQDEDTNQSVETKKKDTLPDNTSKTEKSDK